MSNIKKKTSNDWKFRCITSLDVLNLKVMVNIAFKNKKSERAQVYLVIR